MLSMERAFHSERTLRQVTGLSIEEFEALRPPFEEALAMAGQDERQPRSSAGRKPSLATGAEKLFFILFYVKCYLPFDVLGFLFEVHAAQACLFDVNYFGRSATISLAGWLTGLVRLPSQ